MDIVTRFNPSVDAVQDVRVNRKRFYHSRGMQNLRNYCLESIYSLESDTNAPIQALVNFEKSLSTLQCDTLTEMLGATSCILDFEMKEPGFLDIIRTNEPTDRYSEKLFEIPEEIRPRLLLATIISNAANRIDAATERTLRHSMNPILKFDDPSTLFSKVVDKAKMSLHYGPNEISFDELCESIYTYANFIGLNGSNIISNITSIIDAQKQSYTTLINPYGYSYEEAIQYRFNTIVKYAELLGEIIFTNPEEYKEFIKLMVITQVNDDFEDRDEDINRQINPWNSNDISNTVSIDKIKYQMIKDYLLPIMHERDIYTGRSGKEVLSLRRKSQMFDNYL